MKRFTPPIYVKLFLSVIVFSFISCASDVFDSEGSQDINKISTAVSVKQVEATGNENISRGETKAPEMCTFKIEGAKGEMYMRYTAAAGIASDETFNETLPSRGKMITTDDFYDGYGLFIYEYPQDQTWSTVSATATPTVVNEEVIRSTSWMTNEYWPGTGRKLALYGYAPYGATGITNLPTLSTAGKPKFHYVTPSLAINQNDLLVSEDDEFVSSINEKGGVDVPGNYNNIKILKFKHACTAVRIAVGEQMAPCTITKIAIKGVYGEADYNYGAGSGLNEGSWENYSSTTSDYTLDADFTITASDKNKIINTGKHTFMLLPQTVPNDAVIEITIDDGVEHVLKASIGGNKWKMGYSVTYFLTTSTVDNKYILTISPTGGDVSSTGGTSSFSIRSYRQTFYGSQVAVPWTLTYKYEDEVFGSSQWYGTINDVVTNVSSFSGGGSTTGESNSFQVAKQVERSKPWRSTHTATLRAAAQQGSAGSPVDLSSGKQTANCYVVSAPGYYKFPLVYGNARNADGTANAIAYNSNSDTFVDHNGVHITSPYIYETNGGANVPANAFIVWQDAPHLVTPSSVKLSDDKHYIEFQIEKKNICQGNSVLAVCDANGTIMWSWHIWVTDHSMTNTIEVHNNPDAGGSVVSHFMEVPLGYCDGEVRVRDKRTVTFKVIQTENDGQAATVSFDQLSADSLYTYGNNAPYYQWGRKDPMLPSNGMGDIDKPFYDKQREWKRTYSFISTGGAIQAPFTAYYVSGNDWSESHSFQFWNINFSTNSDPGITNTTTIKTIYDPSVSGFTLPKTAAFTFFTVNGTNSTSYGEFNVNGSYSKGWTFYINGWRQGETILFEALGYRNSDNAYVLASVGQHGFYWSAGAASTVNGRYLYFNSGAVFPVNTYFRSLGFPIRPVVE